jgi:hypothetical protein
VFEGVPSGRHLIETEHLGRGVTILSLLFGHWSVVLGWAHQATGLVFHYWFCRRHGSTWYSVEAPDRYIALSKAWIGATEEPSSTPD